LIGVTVSVDAIQCRFVPSVPSNWPVILSPAYSLGLGTLALVTFTALTELSVSCDVPTNASPGFDEVTE